MSRKPADLTGQRFGRLTALHPTEMRRFESIVWECRCDCGNTCYIPAKQLRSGNTQSCGCLQQPLHKDLTGQRFGLLTVLEYAGKKGNMHRWRCQCDCGNETVVGQALLLDGRTRSCGCIRADGMRARRKLVDGTSITALEHTREKPLRNNRSGHTGVYQNKRTGKWAAQITFKGKTHYLGTFDKIEDAIRARKRGEELHEDFLAEYYAHEKTVD